MATSSTESRRVLVAVDGSKASQKAVDFYLNDVMKADDTVLLVHMFDAPAPPAVSLRHPSAEPWDEWRLAVDKKLKDVREMMKAHERACDAKNLKQKIIIHTGLPGEGICKIIEENNPILAVMGSRGLNLIRRTFMGSVSSYVLHHVSIPVIIIPHPEG
eukprot:gene11311-12493_t